LEAQEARTESPSGTSHTSSFPHYPPPEPHSISHLQVTPSPIRVTIPNSEQLRP
jgi:nitrate reductase cytochrome c-type subunit